MVGNTIRKIVLDMVYNKKSGHLGGSFSCADLLAFLFTDYDPLGRDKVILSKGHAAPALYACLHLKGIIVKEELATFRELDSRLQGHPDKVAFPQVCATTGSLGQGLSIAVGHALAKKLKKEKGFVFCILGDGEMQEGQVMEAIMFANGHSLNNLIIFIDNNNLQNDSSLCFSSIHLDPEYYNMYEIDGHKPKSYATLKNYIQKNQHGPMIVNLKTIKGKGVSFMENQVDWHSKVPNETEYNVAMRELG